MPGRVLARADQAPEAPHGGSRRVSMPLMRGRALFPWSVRPRGRPRLTTRVTGSAPGAASRGDRAQADGATRGPAAEWPAVPPGPVAPRAGGEVAAAGVVPQKALTYLIEEVSLWAYLLVFAVVVIGCGWLYSFLTAHGHGVNASPLGFLDGVFFSIVTVTSLGYGDLYPVGFSRVIAGVQRCCLASRSWAS